MHREGLKGLGFGFYGDPGRQPLGVDSGSFLKLRVPPFEAQGPTFRC